MFAMHTLRFVLAIYLLLSWEAEVSCAAALSRSRVKRQYIVNTSKKGFTSAEKIDIVNIHNSLRKSVTPSAKNMRLMTWRDDLAAMAQNWTDGCLFKHGNPTVSSPPYSYIGQNLYARTSGYNVTLAVQSWFNEVSFYTYNNNTCQTNKVCGHYTQVVWAATDRVGCGITFCPTLSTLTNAYFIACNYGPGGNYIGTWPYLSGTPCSGCSAYADTPTCSNSAFCKPSTLCASPSTACANYNVDTCVCP